MYLFLETANTWPGAVVEVAGIFGFCFLMWVILR